MTKNGTFLSDAAGWSIAMDREESPAEIDAALDWQQAADGVRRHAPTYKNGTIMVRVEFDAGAIAPPHAHAPVQWSLVESGVFDVTIAGRTERLTTGDSFLVPSGAVHGAVNVEAGVLLDVFNPRADGGPSNEPSRSEADMRSFARIERGLVTQIVTLPAELTPADILTPMSGATILDVTDVVPAPSIGWLHKRDGALAPPPSLVPGLAPEETKSRAQALLYGSDSAIEQFYMQGLPIPSDWTRYRAALRLIIATGTVPDRGPPEQPSLPAFGVPGERAQAPAR